MFIILQSRYGIYDIDLEIPMGCIAFHPLSIKD